jgi:hypothetical protein
MTSDISYDSTTDTSLKWKILKIFGRLNADRKEGNSGYRVFGGLARDIAMIVLTQDDKKRTLPPTGDIDVRIDTLEDVKDFVDAATGDGLGVEVNESRLISRKRIYGQNANAGQSLDVSLHVSEGNVVSVSVDFALNGDPYLFPTDFAANMLLFRPTVDHKSLEDIFNSLSIIDEKVHSSPTTL